MATPPDPALNSHVVKETRGEKGERGGGDGGDILIYEERRISKKREKKKSDQVKKGGRIDGIKEVEGGRGGGGRV